MRPYYVCFGLATLLLAFGLAFPETTRAQGRPPKADKGLSTAQGKAAMQAQYALSQPVGLSMALQMAAAQAQQNLLLAQQNVEQKGKGKGQQQGQMQGKGKGQQQGQMQGKGKGQGAGKGKGKGKGA